jgi:large subunit GTPase 1
VLERSHLIVQILDARNPLNFRCPDLESFVLDVEGSEGERGTGKGLRRNLLLINKADLLTARQRKVMTWSPTWFLIFILHVFRCLWADYFDTQNVRYAFFSAANAAALQELRREMQVANEASANHDTEHNMGHDDDDSGSNDSAQDDVPDEQSSEGNSSDVYHSLLVNEENTPDERDPRAKVLSVLELEDLFLQVAPDLSGEFYLVDNPGV